MHAGSTSLLALANGKSELAQSYVTPAITPTPRIIFEYATCICTAIAPPEDTPETDVCWMSIP
jgi:hypothetical protein